MATCKDCIHYNLCRSISRIQLGWRGNSVHYVENVEEICKDFKGRSRFVELPCKVGDTVYCGSFGKIMEDEIKCIIIDADETRMMLKRGISYDIDFINQMFFFTREEAEQVMRALKEREHNA